MGRRRRVAEDERMYPCDARERNLTYSVKLMATVTQMQDITYTSSDKVITREIDSPEKRIPLGYIPIWYQGCINIICLNNILVSILSL